MLIRRVSAKDCYALRESILRPGQPIENWTFEADDDPKAIHIAIEQADEIVGVVSLLPETHESCPNHPWRLRAMAVREDLQGHGIGGKLIVALMETVDAGIWCTARKHVAEFYARHGFTQSGDEFTMNNMPHIRMMTS